MVGKSVADIQEIDSTNDRSRNRLVSANIDVIYYSIRRNPGSIIEKWSNRLESFERIAGVLYK